MWEAEHKISRCKTTNKYLRLLYDDERIRSGVKSEEKLNGGSEGFEPVVLQYIQRSRYSFNARPSFVVQLLTGAEIYQGDKMSPQNL